MVEQHIPLIEQTYVVILPSGRKAKLNCFDMNLAMFCGGDKYIQLEDTSWIKATSLKIIPEH